MRFGSLTSFEASFSIALTSFEQFGMIAFVDGAVIIPKWEKHQNIDGLEKIR